MIKAVVLSLVLSIFAAPNLRAEMRNIQFQHFSVAEGLSHNTIYDIAQDQQGLIWIATPNGLNRFDGYDFKNYSESNSSKGLPSDIIYSLLVDSRDQLWIGSESGLAKYQQETDDFIEHQLPRELPRQRFQQNSIWQLLEDSSGTIWATTNAGIFKLAENADSFISVVLNDGSAIKNTRTIFETPQNEIIFGTADQGNYVYSLADGSLRPLAHHALAKLQLFAAADFNESSLISTDQGLFQLDEMSGKPMKQMVTQLQDAIVVTAIGIDAHRLWLGTEQGLVIYEPASGWSRLVTQFSDYPNSLRSDVISSIFVDQAGTVWVGTYNGGLHKYNSSIATFKHISAIPNSEFGLASNTVATFAEDIEGFIWIANRNGGINRFDPRSNKFQQYLVDFNATVWDMAALENGLLWLSTSRGIYVFDPQSWQIRHLDLKVELGNITGIANFKNRVWIGTEGNGLLSYQMENGLVSQLANISEISSGSVTPLSAGPSGKLWLNKVTQQGSQLYSLDSQDYQLHYFSELPKNILISDISENDAAYWIGTQENGIYRIDKLSGDVSNINLDSGLSSNNISALKIVAEQLWLATPHGLNKYDLKTQTITQFKHQLGLAGNEFTQQASILTTDGLLMFGGSNGINIVDTALANSSNFPEKNYRPLPIITEIEITDTGNKELSENDPQSVLTANSFKLSENQTAFAIHFALPNVLEPENVIYRYRLPGLIDGWLETTADNRKAFFTNIAAGSYQFELQAKQQNTDWSDSRVLQINVSPALWLSPIAQVLYALTLVAICGLVYRTYAKRQSLVPKLEVNNETLTADITPIEHKVDEVKTKQVPRLTEEQIKNLQRKKKIEILISHGLKEDLFSVFYQPKVNITNGRLVGIEALVRYHHPDKGLITPDRFIEIAEQNNQIIEITDRVLRQACRAAKSWIDEELFKGRIAINLSANHFSSGDLTKQIKRVLLDSGLSSSYLELELTEKALMSNYDNVIESMISLVRKGVTFVLDDFGSGDSSLAKLKQLPISALKIDKTLIDNIEHSNHDKQMALSIVSIARSMNLSVIAEGVHNEAQLKLLRDMGCDLVQGFIFSKPLSENKCTELLKGSHAVKQQLKVR